MQTAACPVCDIQDSEFLFNSPAREFDRRAFFRLVRCVRCGLVRVDPRPSPDELEKYYPDENWPRTQSADPLNVKILGVAWRDLMQERAAQVRRAVRGPARLLEIGCGDGYFLRYMQDLGWDVEGIEPGRPAAEYAARRLGVRVHRGFVSEAISLPGRYRVIYMHHAFEHIAQPVEALRRLKSLLEPEGWLYLAVPNWESLDRKIFGSSWMALKTPQHLFLYDRRTLALVLAKAGFAARFWDTYAVEATTLPLGYSESFRHRLGDWGFYPQRVPLKETRLPARGQEYPFRSPVFWKRQFQRIEQGGWRGIAALASRLGRGTNLRMWAQPA